MLYLYSTKGMSVNHIKKKKKLLVRHKNERSYKKKIQYITGKKFKYS